MMNRTIRTVGGRRKVLVDVAEDLGSRVGLDDGANQSANVVYLNPSPSADARRVY